MSNFEIEHGIDFNFPLSPYFCKIFEDNPGKHPVIVLRDMQGWQVQCIVDFMYKGETSVPEAQLQSLIRAAESLKVRGLTSGEAAAANSPDPRTTTIEDPTPYKCRRYTPSPTIYHTQGQDKHSGQSSPVSLTHQGSDHEARSRSPVGSGPRRKQARPRRRSGDSVSGVGASLDLTREGGSAHDSAHEDGHGGSNGPENLCLKRPGSSPAINLVSDSLVMMKDG